MVNIKTHTYIWSLWVASKYKGKQVRFLGLTKEGVNFLLLHLYPQWSVVDIFSRIRHSRKMPSEILFYFRENTQSYFIFHRGTTWLHILARFWGRDLVLKACQRACRLKLSTNESYFIVTFFFELSHHFFAILFCFILFQTLCFSIELCYE